MDGEERKRCESRPERAQMLLEKIGHGNDRKLLVYAYVSLIELDSEGIEITDDKLHNFKRAILKMYRVNNDANKIFDNLMYDSDSLSETIKKKLIEISKFFGLWEEIDDFENIKNELMRSLWISNEVIRLMMLEDFFNKKKGQSE